jgi:hypothetical protein
MTWTTGMETDDVLEVLERTRTIRLALDSLEENLTPDLMSGGLESELTMLRQKLSELERKRLRMIGHKEYMILAPKSYAERYGDEAIAAMKTLDDLGLVIPLYDF